MKPISNYLTEVFGGCCLRIKLTVCLSFLAIVTFGIIFIHFGGAFGSIIAIILISIALVWQFVPISQQVQPSSPSKPPQDAQQFALTSSHNPSYTCLILFPTP